MAVSAVVPPEYDMVTIITATGFTPDDAWYENGSLFIEGPTQTDLDTAVTNYTPTHAASHLQKLKDSANSIVDFAAGAARERYITTVPGQSETYLEKSDEATDFVAAAYPTDLTSYPFIQAEVNATGKTPTQASDDILSKRSSWIALGAQIEQERIGGKVNIAAASDEASIVIARDAAMASLNAI